MFVPDILNVICKVKCSYIGTPRKCTRNFSIINEHTVTIPRKQSSVELFDWLCSVVPVNVRYILAIKFLWGEVGVFLDFGFSFPVFIFKKRASNSDRLLRKKGVKIEG